MTNTEKKVKPLKNSKPLTKPTGAKARKKSNFLNETEAHLKWLDKQFGVNDPVDTSYPFSGHLAGQLTIIRAAVKRIVVIAQAYDL